LTSGKVLPILKALRVWVFVAKFTDGFNLGMDVLPTWDTTVPLKRHVLQLGEEDVSLWRPGSSLLTTANDQLILARCERVVIALLGSHPEAIKCLVHPTWRLFTARTLVHARRMVPIRISNVRNRGEVLTLWAVRTSHVGRASGKFSD
jgi:hypothetical protein